MTIVRDFLIRDLHAVKIHGSDNPTSQAVKSEFVREVVFVKAHGFGYKDGVLIEEGDSFRIWDLPIHVGSEDENNKEVHFYCNDERQGEAVSLPKDCSKIYAVSTDGAIFIRLNPFSRREYKATAFRRGDDTFCGEKDYNFNTCLTKEETTVRPLTPEENPCSGTSYPSQWHTKTSIVKIIVEKNGSALLETTETILKTEPPVMWKPKMK